MLIFSFSVSGCTLALTTYHFIINLDMEWLVWPQDCLHEAGGCRQSEPEDGEGWPAAVLHLCLSGAHTPWQCTLSHSKYCADSWSQRLQNIEIFDWKLWYFSLWNTISTSYRAGARDHQLQSLHADDKLVACHLMVIVKHAVCLYVLIM